MNLSYNVVATHCENDAGRVLLITLSLSASKDMTPEEPFSNPQSRNSRPKFFVLLSGYPYVCTISCILGNDETELAIHGIRVCYGNVR
jgi:hypothetical protein